MSAQHVTEARGKVRRLSSPEWRPLLLALAGLLAVLALTLGPRAQAGNRIFQTVPTPTPRTIPTPTRPVTPRPSEEAPPARGTLALSLTAIPHDVLPGDELQFRLWLTNTSAVAITGLIVADPLDPAMELLEVRATQGAADLRDHLLTLDLGTLDAGQRVLVLLRSRVSPQARPGQIVLNQVTAYFDGGQVTSNVAAAGLPPDELPATGQERRGP